MSVEFDRGTGVRRVLFLTLALNFLVAGAKIAYGHFADVLSVRADGFHSMTDASNNLVGLIGVHLARRPADEDHPYGHEKFEILAAGIVGLSLLGMAYDVLRSAFERWTSDVAPPVLDATVFIVLVATLVVNLFVASYERRMGEKLASPFLLSDAAHTRSDVFVTLGVMATAALIQLGYAKLDALMAILIAGFIAFAGIDVLRRNLKYLADGRAIDSGLVEKAVLLVPGVASTHKIRTRGSPGAIHVDLHIQIARHLDVVQAHQVTHWVVDAIKREIPGVVDVLVHTEPARPEQSFNPMPADRAERALAARSSEPHDPRQSSADKG
jgi:cation diffusion facilitator family transporter